MGWQPISDGRMANGKLWLPLLSLDLMERDWQAFSHPLNWEMSAKNKGSLSASYANWFTWGWWPPDDYDFDAQFGVLSLTIFMTFQVTFSGGSITDQGRVQIENGDGEVQVFDPGGPEDVTLSRTYTTAITTKQTEQIQVRNDGAGSSTTVDGVRTYKDADDYMVVVVA